MNELSGPHTWASQHPKQFKQLLYGSILFFALLAAAILLWPTKALEAPLGVLGPRTVKQATKPVPAPAKAKSALPDPCRLKDVVCDGGKKIIKATVTTYQAVKGQTDATPCQGAMAGVDFCRPPFEIVANNCLKLGTKVWIEETLFVVADRMNSRFGCDHFDILIMPYDQPFTLTNEPVTIL